MEVDKAIFTLDKWMKVFLHFEDGIYTSKFNKKINISYSYLVKILHKSINYGLIRIEKKGRIKLLYLTPKGQKLKKDILTIVEDIGYYKNGRVENFYKN